MNDIEKLTSIIEKMASIMDKQVDMISNLYAILSTKGTFNELDSNLIAGKITLDEYIKKASEA